MTQMSGVEGVRVTTTQHTKCYLCFCRLVSEQSADRMKQMSGVEIIGV